MAKLTVSVTVTVTALLFLFTFSDAHLQVYPTDNDVTKPETDADPTLLLPSEKLPESAVDAEIEAVDVSDLLPEEPTTTTATFVKFRPINRHFSVHRQFPLRTMRRRPCRHHHNKPFSSARSGEISYGDDMILDPRFRKISYGDRVIFDRDPEVLFRDHVMPSMTLRLQGENGVHHHHHHHRSHDKFMPKYVFAKEKLKRPFRREDEEEEIEKEKKQEERENGGFVKGIRKFLNHF